MFNKRLVFPLIILAFGCTPQTGYYLRNTSEYDQKVIISLGNFFEEQKQTELQLKYALRVVKVGNNSHKKLKGELKPKHLNSRQLEVTLPGESTVYINAQNPSFSNLLAQKIKNTIGLSMKIELLPLGSIPRSQGGKLSRIVDLRK